MEQKDIVNWFVKKEYFLGHPVDQPTDVKRYHDIAFSPDLVYHNS